MTIPARFRFYVSSDGQKPEHLCLIRLQSNGQLMAHHTGDSYEQVRDEAVTWWAEHSAKYEKAAIDARKTTTVEGQLKRQLLRLSKLLETHFPEPIDVE